MRTIKKTMAWLLAVTMILTSADYIHAAEALQENVMTEVSDGDSSAAAVSAGEVLTVSENETTDISENYASGDGEDVSENDTEGPGDVGAAAGEVLYSGEEEGVIWSITTDGVLTIGGSYQGTESIEKGWLAYKSFIKKIIVTAENVHNTSSWFSGCSNVTEVDLSYFDTSKVTDMRSMFSDCSSLESLDLGNFETGNVTIMDRMFYGCNSLTSVDLKSFETGNVILMDSMFSGCSSLTSLDLGSFETGNVTSMASMFYDCSSLTSVDLSNFETGNVTSMASMFYDCSSLTSVDLSNFETGNVMFMSSMFGGCSSLTSLDLGSFETGNVRNMNHMFYDCSSLASVDLSSFETSNVTNMKYMFYDCSSLASVDLSSFETGNVTSMDSMFYGCNSLVSVDLSSFETGNVTNIKYMFRGCNSLTSLDLSNFDVSSLQNAYDMLWGCSGLYELKCVAGLQQDIDLPHVMQDEEGNEYTALPKGLPEGILLHVKEIASGEVSGIEWILGGNGTLMISGEYDGTDMEGTELPWHAYADRIRIAVINAQNVESTAYWFDGCHELRTLYLSGFDTSKLTNMEAMFRNCTELYSLDVSDLDMSKVVNANEMFAGCSGLRLIKCFKNLKISIALPHHMLGKIEGRYTEYIEFPLNIQDDIQLIRGNAYGSLDGLRWYIIASDRMLYITGENTATELPEKSVAYGWTNNAVAGGYSKVIVDAKGVLSTARWFKDYTNIKELDLSGFDTSSLVETTDMLTGCTGLEKLSTPKNLTCEVALPVDLVDGELNIYKTIPMNKSDSIVLQRAAATGTYYGMTWMIAKEGLLKITGVYGSSVTTDTSWKDYAEIIKHVKVTATGVKSTADWFFGLEQLETVDFSDFDTSIVTDMSGMFRDCGNLKTLDLSTFNTANVKSMRGMFENCDALTELNISGFDTSKVTDMGYLFCKCEQLENLELNAWNTAAVEDMTAMFSYCEALTELDFSNFSMGNVTKADAMVCGCSDIKMIGVPANLTLDIAVPKTMYNYLGEPQTDIFPKYQPEAEWYYAVSPVEEGRLHVSKVAPQTYTGKAIKPRIRIYDGTTLLVEKKDYTITYKNNTKAAAKDAVNAKGKSIAPTIIVKGKGNYTKTETVTFDILAKDLSDEDVVAGELVAVAGKKVQKPVPKLTYNGKKLVNKKDFTVSYPDLEDETIVDAYKAPGTYTVVVTGKGNFTGTRELTFTITGGTLMSKVKIAKIPNQTYTGSDIEPVIKVTHGKKELVQDTDYTVDYDNNIEIGKATVTITGKGDYIGTKTATFQIVGQSIAKAKVAGIEAKTYNGKEQTQDITVTLNGQEQPLVAEKDYTVSYTKNVNAGTATMVIKGVGAYTGTIKKTFKINAYDLETDADKLLSGVPENLTVVYEKGGSKPKLVLTFDGAAMTATKDYTVSYANNTKVTTAETTKIPTITIKGKGNFKGRVQVSFVIEPKQIEDMQITLPDVAYSKSKGKYVSKPVLTDSNGKKLVAGTDYEKAVVYKLADGTVLDKNNVVEAGQTITVTVTGKGNYTGTTEATYRVTRASFKSAKITIAPQVYTGKEILLTEDDITSVKIGKDTLVYGEDYEIVEGSYKNNIKKGTASVTIKGKGNYGGEKTVKFKIAPKELIWFWRLFG